MNGEPWRPIPKPVRAEKEPKRLRQVSEKRQRRIDAGEERPGLNRGRPMRRRGARQFAHLGNRKTNGGFRKCPDGEGGCLCAHHHQLVDNPTGWSGRGGFYLDMSAQERGAFRIGAMAAADEAWSSLTPEQQDFWTDRAAMRGAA